MKDLNIKLKKGGLNEYRTTLGQNAKNSVRARFDLDRNTDYFIETYRLILKKK